MIRESAHPFFNQPEQPGVSCVEEHLETTRPHEGQVRNLPIFEFAVRLDNSENLARLLERKL
jgi:hypothetical protein